MQEDQELDQEARALILARMGRERPHDPFNIMRGGEGLISMSPPRQGGLYRKPEPPPGLHEPNALESIAMLAVIVSIAIGGVISTVVIFGHAITGTLFDWAASVLGWTMVAVVAIAMFFPWVIPVMLLFGLMLVISSCWESDQRRIIREGLKRERERR